MSPATAPGSSAITVLFVNTDLRVGGQESALVEIMRGFDREKIRPVVACLKEAGELASRVRAAGIPLYCDLLSSKFDVRVLPRLVRIIRRERVRVVCTVGSGDKLFWGRLAGFVARVDGIVATLHKTRSADGRPVVEPLNRLLTPITDAFVAVARGAAEYLIHEEGLPRSKVHVIYNGVDLDRFSGAGRASARAELGLAHDAPVAVHVAQLRPEKGHDVLLDAAAIVAGRIPAVRFLLVGDGPLRATIEARVRDLGLERTVTLLGIRHDVPHVLAAADVALLPSHARVETFPNSILEAMASGLPIVASRVGSLDEMVEDRVNGYLLPAGDAPALAQAIFELLSDPVRASQMGASARARVGEHFTRERAIRAREELFSSLVHARRPRPAG
jgi:glycosyltransferase involved in cell wall biosynthesis